MDFFPMAEFAIEFFHFRRTGGDTTVDTTVRCPEGYRERSMASMNVRVLTWMWLTNISCRFL
jgi:hypothetical protein